MTIQEAIIKAIEGGWHTPAAFRLNKEYWLNENDMSIKDIKERYTVTFLDPLFWQALGKAMGWKQGTSTEDMVWQCGACGQDCGGYEEWLYHWHRFLDFLAEGKTAEDYFQELK